ncbi:MAG: methionine synthase [Candidatus Goldbacteria bacterium]|nr:methionine synthase [Candidatus Goldiibacteriota bacterium]
MNNKINYFYNIKKEAENKKILFRIGYKSGITKISKKDEKEINLMIKKSKNLCSLKGAYSRFKIFKNKDKIFFNKKIFIKSKNLSKLLIDSDEVVLMAATVGQEIINERDKQMKNGDPVYSIILDATASETADAGLDWIQDFLNTILAKNGMQLTRRYSPGYGDLDISVQKIIYKKLDLKKIGIRITKKYLLIPEKSVLAIAGIIKTEN